MTASRLSRRSLLKAGIAAAGLAGVLGAPMVLDRNKGFYVQLPSADAAPPGEEVLSLTKGSDPGQIGIQEGGPERERCGPESFAVHGDDIYILDTLNRRIQVFNRQGGFRKIISLPGAIYPVDFRIVTENELHVLDTGADSLITVDGGGNLLQRQPIAKELLSRAYQLTIDDHGDVLGTDVGCV